MRTSKIFGILCLVVWAAGLRPSVGYALGKRQTEAPLEVVSPFDLNRYLGKWFEIGSFPQSFQKGCTGTTAEYSMIDESTVRVLNTCFKDSLQGEKKRADGRAKVPNPQEPAKLEVTFFWPFSGAYWVIELGANYEYAVVGHPNRNYLWVLSRSPKMDEALLRQILERQAAKGFEITRFQRTLQANE